jgi:hypothetical protein
MVAGRTRRVVSDDKRLYRHHFVSAMTTFRGARLSAVHDWRHALVAVYFDSSY